jgi:hypothetical protein
MMIASSISQSIAGAAASEQPDQRGNVHKHLPVTAVGGVIAACCNQFMKLGVCCSWFILLW